jgi:anti-sigma factor ChrR (cupin superfamily)
VDARDRFAAAWGTVLKSTAIHADRRLPALVDGESLPWVPSPEPGVERRMLERAGDEVAIATSIVRYGPGVRFPSHMHALGEEFLVLSGIFSDQHGDYPQGTYVRNPPGSTHAPFSDAGCVILVKLRQMQADESESVRDFPSDRRWQRAGGSAHAVLYRNPRLEVSLLRMEPGASLPERETPRGEEFFVVEGEIELLDRFAPALGRWSWRRNAGSRQPALRSPSGALLWIKRGHL